MIYGHSDVLAEIIHRSSFYPYSLRLFMPSIHAERLNTWFLIYQEFLKTSLTEGSSQLHHQY